MSRILMVLLWGGSILAPVHWSGMVQSAAGASHAVGGHSMLNAADLVWTDGPASLPPGARIAVLQGDLTQPGPFTIRLHFPAHYQVLPGTSPLASGYGTRNGALWGLLHGGRRNLRALQGHPACPGRLRRHGNRNPAPWFYPGGGNGVTAACLRPLGHHLRQPSPARCHRLKI